MKDGILLTISPLSDVVLDAARAVEPKGVEAVRAELANRVARASAPSLFSLAGTTAADGVKPATPESFKRFEAMVLQTFIQNMLPKEGAAVYGKGVAGDMWKSLLSEKIAAVMAERGGIGIADRVLGEHYAAANRTPLVEPVSANAPGREASPKASLSPVVVEAMRHNLARLLAGDETGSNSSTHQARID